MQINIVIWLAEILIKSLQPITVKLDVYFDL